MCVRIRDITWEAPSRALSRAAVASADAACCFAAVSSASRRASNDFASCRASLHTRQDLQSCHVWAYLYFSEAHCFGRGKSYCSTALVMLTEDGWLRMRSVSGGLRGRP